MTWRIRAAAAKGAVYFTSSKGIIKSESPSAEMVPAGLPQCLDLVLSLSSAGTPVMMATGFRRAYRAVWCIRDANNNLIQGAPSARFDITNGSGATRDVSISVQIPPEITTSHFLQIYASSMVATAIDPGDELKLVREYFPSSAEITAGTLTYLSIEPDAFRGADLYTNASQDGQAQQNDRPPLARDICWFQGKMYYANYTDLHEMPLQLLGVVGLVAGQTLVLGGTTYTVAAAESVSAGDFLLYSAGTQSVNVETTAKSLCKVINQYPANTTLWAFYDSGVDDPPGRIRLVERSIGGSTFYATCSATAIGNVFSPAIPTSGTTYASVADRRVNQVRESKDGEPEHCPRAGNTIFGGEDEEIQRIVALRSTMIVVKDRSIYRWDGQSAPVFLDNTCGVVGRDSIAVLNNTVFMLSDQGFVAVTDNGVQIVGRPIENIVRAGIEAAKGALFDNYVAVGHETERYYMCTAMDAVSLEPICYVYSPIANQGRGAWTTRLLKANAFAVLDGRLLYAVDSNNGNILQQRASRRAGSDFNNDYREESGTFSISAIDTAANTVTATFTPDVSYSYSLIDSSPREGWKFIDGSAQYLVLSVVGSTFTLNTTADLTTGDKTIYRPVAWRVEYAPIAADAKLKQFGSVILKAETCNARSVKFQFANEKDTKPDIVAQDYTSPPAALTVYVPKSSGQEPSSTSNDFGANSSHTTQPYNKIRTIVPAARAIGQHLSVRISGKTAESYVAIKGLSVTVVPLDSDKVQQ